MLDLTFIRQHPEKVRWAIHVKRAAVDLDAFFHLDEQLRTLESQRSQLRAERNRAAQTQDREKGMQIKEELQRLEREFKELEVQHLELHKKIPNIPRADVPVGAEESENVVLKQVGEKPTFSFPVKDHEALGQKFGWIDSEIAATVTGSRFVYLKGELVLLQFALIQWVFSLLTSENHLRRIAQEAGLPQIALKPFVPVIPPHLIRPEVMDRMARLDPREERYHVEPDDLYLIGSAEHTLGPLHLGQTLEEQILPLRYVGCSPAYRREAGSYGKDIRGILRLHQFDKIEMESFTLAEHARVEQDFFVAIQEYLLRQLELPYQVIAVCTGDMGAPDERQIDIETWMPGQQRYRETHTADLMGDYQSRRLQTKVRRTAGRTEYVHMNDATAIALGRMLIAILENHQQEDGSVRIPSVLHPLLGRERIGL